MTGDQGQLLVVSWGRAFLLMSSVEYDFTIERLVRVSPLKSFLLFF